MTLTQNASQNIAVIERALGALLSTGDVDALADALSEDFVHHRPDSTRSKETWLGAVRRSLVPLAGMEVEIDHMLAAGEHVVMHSRRSLPGGRAAITVVDIWRFESGRIVEAWEIIEPDAQAAVHFEWWLAE